jgi:hypothetical protein
VPPEFMARYYSEPRYKGILAATLEVGLVCLLYDFTCVNRPCIKSLIILYSEPSYKGIPTTIFEVGLVYMC